MSQSKEGEACLGGCNHDGLHAIGSGPSGRNEFCGHAGHCLDVFLAVKEHDKARQSHCPPGCTKFVHYRELESDE
jgi:hypothetical protein